MSLSLAHPFGRIVRSMQGRDIHEAHRASSPLELLFDLTFVAAISAAASHLHHQVAAHNLGMGLVGFGLAFFAIWWAWMNFTWFASAYDTDDTAMRLMTMVQMIGVLIVAAAIPHLAVGEYTMGVMGYVVMRVGLVALWLRAARGHAVRRTTCLRYAFGVLAVQALWVAWLAVPQALTLPLLFVLMVMELAVPFWAERAGGTPWHAHHIAERYSLFTIIVLGECVLGATNAVASVIESSGWHIEAALVGLGVVSLVMSLWWVYFLMPCGPALHAHRERVFKWGYPHVAIFSSLAMLGAFLEVVADQLKAQKPDAAHTLAHAVAPELAIGLVAGAVSVYLVSVWWINAQLTRNLVDHCGAYLCAMLILASVVGAVAMGLPLAWSLPLLTLAPLCVIVASKQAPPGHPDDHLDGHH